MIAYGAPAKAFTLFSYFGLDETKIKYCIDTLEYKAYKFFPDTGIQILPEKELQNIDYDLVLVCAWNYKEEILKKSNKIFKKKYRTNFSNSLSRSCESMINKSKIEDFLG